MIASSDCGSCPAPAISRARPVTARATSLKTSRLISLARYAGSRSDFTSRVRSSATWAASAVSARRRLPSCRSGPASSRFGWLGFRVASGGAAGGAEVRLRVHLTDVLISYSGHRAAERGVLSYSGHRAAERVY